MSVVGAAHGSSFRKLQNGLATAAQIAAPVRLQLAPPLEQIAPEIRPLDPGDHVRKGGLCELSRLAGLGAPIAEAGTETAHRRPIRQSGISQNLCQGHIAQGARAPRGRRKDQVGVLLRNGRARWSTAIAASDRGTAVLDAGLHPVRRNTTLSCASRSISAQVAPRVSPDLATVRTVNHKQSLAVGDVAGGVHGRQGLRDIAVGWSAEVLLYGRLGRQGKAPSMASPAMLCSI